MALITQIKVGGTTYDVAMKAGKGFLITQTGSIELKLGDGLGYDGDSALCVSGLYTELGSGLIDNMGTLDVRVSSGLSILRDGVGVKMGQGISFDGYGALSLNIDTSKLKFDNAGKLTLA